MVRGLSWFSSCISFDSYIKPQLLDIEPTQEYSCISFDSYIKPQPNGVTLDPSTVVYLLIPTSNHNLFLLRWLLPELYIF